MTVALLQNNEQNFQYILENYKEICYNVENAKAKYQNGSDVRIMAVTKTVEPEKINFAVAQGIKLLGENRVQEFLSKKEQYDPSAEVHFIGHLQTNKVKYIINDVSLIQSVDSLKLASEINRLALKNGKKMNVLIEVNVGNELSKSGVGYGDCVSLIKDISLLENVSVKGLMAIPPIGCGEDEFERMHELFENIKFRWCEKVVKDWAEKMDLMVKAAPKWDIGVIVGVPAWVQILLERIIKEYHLKTIHDIWPNLMVYVHSGVAFAPYEKSFERIFGKEVLFVESYLASEGYIAYQVDLKKRVMQLLVDNGIYFEFVPFNEENFDEDGTIVENPKTLLLSEVQTGVDYALLLSTCAGTWRYLIGDTIKFLNTKDCEIVITGRTKQFLSITGEHLSQDNMTRAVDMMAEELGVEITEFTVAGIRHDTMYAHHWYLGCDEPIDKGLAIKKIDENLCKLNDDYAVERTQAIKELFVDVLPTKYFYEFMEQKIGKWGGATKFPRVLKGKRLEMWEEYVKGLKA